MVPWLHRHNVVSKSFIPLPFSPDSASSHVYIASVPKAEANCRGSCGQKWSKMVFSMYINMHVYRLKPSSKRSLFKLIISNQTLIKLKGMCV